MPQYSEPSPPTALAGAPAGYATSSRSACTSLAGSLPGGPGQRGTGPGRGPEHRAYASSEISDTLARLPVPSLLSHLTSLAAATLG